MKGSFVKALMIALLAMPALWSQATTDCPCCDPVYRSFDFWIGEWEVTLADGSPAGTNRIVPLQDGCVLQEHWVSARPGTTGTSLTFYDRGSGKWEQLWVDNSGNVLKLSGGPGENGMVLTSDPAPGPDGTLLVNRITWTLEGDGRVRQLWEVLRKGKVTGVLFDGYYEKTRN